MIAIQICIAVALLVVVFIYGVLALTDIDEQLNGLGYQPSGRNESEAPGDE